MSVLKTSRCTKRAFLPIGTTILTAAAFIAMSWHRGSGDSSHGQRKLLAHQLKRQAQAAARAAKAASRRFKMPIAPHRPTQRHRETLRKVWRASYSPLAESTLPRLRRNMGKAFSEPLETFIQLITMPAMGITIMFFAPIEQVGSKLPARSSQAFLRHLGVFKGFLEKVQQALLHHIGGKHSLVAPIKFKTKEAEKNVVKAFNKKLEKILKDHSEKYHYAELLKALVPITKETTLTCLERILQYINMMSQFVERKIQDLEKAWVEEVIISAPGDDPSDSELPEAEGSRKSAGEKDPVQITTDIDGLTLD